VKIATAELVGLSPYSCSRYYVTEVPKLNEGKEDHWEYEKRTWRHKMHTDEEGTVFIPPMAFKLSIAEAAKYGGRKTEGSAKWTKHFEAGVQCFVPAKLGINIKDVDFHDLLVPSDGKPGGSKKVVKRFPIIRQWKTTVEFFIVDERIHEKIFRIHLEEAGQVIGVGSFRPRNRGFFGRWEVKSVTWKNA
jgi:hypothetical protein